MSARQPVFFYDLGDPWSYLAAEQVLTALPEVPEWEPISAGALEVAASERVELGAGERAIELGAGERAATELGAGEREAVDRAAVERRAGELGLQPIRWPAGWPPETRTAMVGATYAKRVGRGVAFSLAAFRQAFAGGRDLGDRDTVLIAGAACEMHPTALLKGMGLRSVSEALEAAGARAVRAGVRTVPAIEMGGRVFQGPDAVEQATGISDPRR